MLSRNRVQMQYKKSYQSNRESKQWTYAMIMLVERYCKTCICLSLFTSCNDIYMYTQETSFNSFIIDSDFDLFLLTNYLVRIMQTVLQHLFLIQLVIVSWSLQKKSRRKQKENSKRTIYSSTLKKTEKMQFIINVQAITLEWFHLLFFIDLISFLT